jgi:putative transposase
MPRQARVVIPLIPHHVTQRGNHRARVFFDKGDPEAYLCLLHAYARQQEVALSAYCLMPNHVHLVVVPASADGLHRALRAVHSQYAQRINRMRELKGHLWQGRYFSSPLDASYFMNAVRYVELNPVRAGLVAKAEAYAWSSAAAHCGLRYDPLLEAIPKSSPLAGISNWSQWLSKGVPDESMKILRQHGSRNLPCGSSDFIAQLETSTGRELRYRTRGGQPRSRHAQYEGARPLHEYEGARPLQGPLQGATS